MSDQIKGQMNLDIALRRTCNIDSSYPCTYYFANQAKYLTTGKECENTCCYGRSKNTCGYACNARRDLKNK